VPEIPAATVVYRPAEPLEPEPEAGPEPPAPEPPLPETGTLPIADRVFPVTSGRVVLGRSRECDIRVADANVSRRHCEIVQDGPTVWSVADLGSTNGTELNGRQVQRAELSDGDRITVGGTDIVFARTLS
jgi:pSer/pThr/pTyr-binding forkhead associated (FHA) protein